MPKEKGMHLKRHPTMLLEAINQRHGQPYKKLLRWVTKRTFMKKVARKGKDDILEIKQ